MYYCIPASDNPKVNDTIIETLKECLKTLPEPKSHKTAYLAYQDGKIFVRKLTDYKTKEVDKVVSLCERLAKKYDLNFELHPID